MKAAELRETTVDELRKKEQDLRKELFNLRFQQATGEIEDPYAYPSDQEKHCKDTVDTNREEQDQVDVAESEHRGLTLLELYMAPGDLGRVIGRQGRTAQAIRTLVSLAAEHPERDFLGIEGHRPGVGHLMPLAEAADLRNVRVVCRDAVQVLERRIPDASVGEVKLLFPDPWPKKRHHKRRIVQPEFAALLAAKLAPGGVFHVATDWAPYAEHIAAVLGAQPAFEPHRPAAPDRAETRFERRGRRLGHEVFEQAWPRSTGPRS